MENKARPFLKLPIDHSWTLFLDRDGVINVNKADSYVFNTDEFIFSEGALEAILRISKVFGKIIVITNQRGVEKGLMTEEDLIVIHQYMKEKIEWVGGRIDGIFYCTAMDDAHPDRKPNPGMAYKAKEKFPEIDFSKSIMIGDKLSDMQWARTIGAYGVLITPTPLCVDASGSDADYKCDSLYAFSICCGKFGN